MDLVSGKELRRIIGLQLYKITNISGREVSTFWLTGGTNFYARGYEAPYKKSPLAPSPSGCIVTSVDPVPDSVFTNVFRVRTVLGLNLIFRFSPTEAFPPTVEIDPASATPFTIEISVLSVVPGAGQNLQSINGNYNRGVETFDYQLDAVDINSYIPIPLRRVVGFQIWGVELFNGTRWEEGGTFTISYGDREEGGYPGLCSPNSVAKILSTDGLNVARLPVPQNSGIEYARTFRITLIPSGRAFDFWYNTVTYAPTIRSQGLPLPPGYGLRVRIQIINFNA